MDIYIFTEDLNFIGIIDSFISLRWVRRYHKAGEFELHCSLTTKTLKMLKKNYLIWKRGDSEAGFITYRQLKQDDQGKEVLIIKGIFITGCLNKRIIWNTENLKTTAELAMRDLVNKNGINPIDENRKIPLLSLAQLKNYSQTIDRQVSYSNLLSELENISRVSGLGYRVLANIAQKHFVFDVYEGRDLTINQTVNPPAIFSNEFENVFEQEYIESSNNYKSIALVAGEGEGQYRKVVTVGEGKGLNRYELFVDARDVQSKFYEDGEEITISPEEYEQLLIDRGRVKLAEYTKIQTFESKININGNLQYRHDFDLGDIVTINNRRWDITIDTRITEIEEIYEADGVKINATFGNSIPTLADRIKQVVR